MRRPTWSAVSSAVTSRTVVLVAMEPELAALRARMTDTRETSEQGVLLVRGGLAARPVTAVLCGIGKVAAATAAVAAALTEEPHVLISAGVAGGVRADVQHGA